MPGRRATAIAPVWAPPDASRSAHFVGDVHVEVSIPALQQRVVADLSAMTAVVRVQVGDLADNLSGDPSLFAANDVAGKAYLAQFGAPLELALGNHDVFRNGRTVTEWEAAYGTQRNRVVDAGPFLLVFIGPDVMFEASEHIVVPTSTVDWLDSQLAVATKPCVVVCHAPLFNTVIGIARMSTHDSVYVTVDQPSNLGGTDAALRAVLGDHSSAFAFVSGHTHSDPVNSGGFVKREAVGGRHVAAINTSAVAYVFTSPQTTADPIRTVLVTVPSSGDRVEARVRDHTLRKWIPCATGDLVATVLL